MKLHLQPVCQLLLSLCCVLTTVRESDGTFVPGRCLCQDTEQAVRGKLRELSVYPRSPTCDRVTVIVTMSRDNETVCLNPDAPMGKRLVRCWNRARVSGFDVKRCLRTRRKRRGHNKKPSNPQ